MIFVLIFIKMKEESVRHREMENQRHREVSTLKKQTRKNESKIKSLEAEKRMKELALKRKNEEVKNNGATMIYSSHTHRILEDNFFYLQSSKCNFGVFKSPQNPSNFL